jgi:outer membrane receptor protein involved in Fe transport
MKIKIFLGWVMLLGLPMCLLAQKSNVSVSGMIKDKASSQALPYVNVILKTASDSAFLQGTITDDRGMYVLSNVASNDYFIEFSFVGYDALRKQIYVGTLSDYLDLGVYTLDESVQTLTAVQVTAEQMGVSSKMDKKSYSVAENASQSGGSVLQAMQNLPGVTIQDGKIQLRGNDKIMVLIDGKQTALTGFGSQSGLDNIPSSAIEKIEIINNPSSKYDANGNGGIINIVFKKEKQTGFNGKVGLASGVGALWVRKENLPNIRPQYVATPKVNPSLSLNYRKDKINAFFQADNLYTHTLNKNEFVTRRYDDGTVIEQQLKRNRNTNFFTAKMGLDWQRDDQNTFSFSTLFGSEKIIDRGDEPFFNGDYSERLRLWQFLEDELKTTLMVTGGYQHKFDQPGHKINIGLNYTFHRENEQYFFDNILASSSGKDAFKLLSDEHVADLTLDYTKPLQTGKFEGGMKFRRRVIPTNMKFFPGQNSPIDSTAGGWATYKETIPALYGNYVYETAKFDAEIGLRLEYVDLHYDVNPGHNTYKSNGYGYAQPFPSARLAYKLGQNSKITAFYNRRVDRPNEVDIRIFPKYDDAEIIKVGNPALRPQFTNTYEIGQKNTWSRGDFYLAMYHKQADATITRLSTTVPGSTLIYAIFQNVGKSYNSGLEMVFSQELTDWLSINMNGNMYRNQINAFSVVNLYPETHVFSAARQRIISGNAKANANFHLKKGLEMQVSTIYLAPDIIPQGRIAARYAVNAGMKKSLQAGKGELSFNATDIFNTLIIKKNIQGNNFTYQSTDYYETQVFRLGYSYKF